MERNEEKRERRDWREMREKRERVGRDWREMRERGWARMAGNAGKARKMTHYFLLAKPTKTISFLCVLCDFAVIFYTARFARGRRDAEGLIPEIGIK